MIWLAEWKKYLVYQGVHQIILEGLDSQGKRHSEGSTDFKVDEIDFFMNFWNSDVLKGRSDEIQCVKTAIEQEFPWIWGYYSGKQIRLGVPLWGSTPVTAPDYYETLYALRELELIGANSTDLPFPKLFIGQTQAELNTRAAHTAELITLEAAGDAVAHSELLAEALSPCVYELHDNSRRILITDANKATSIIVEKRLVSRQFRNDDELHHDQNLEIAQ